MANPVIGAGAKKEKRESKSELRGGPKNAAERRALSQTFDAAEWGRGVDRCPLMSPSTTETTTTSILQSTTTLSKTRTTTARIMNLSCGIRRAFRLLVLFGGGTRMMSAQGMLVNSPETSPEEFATIRPAHQKLDRGRTSRRKKEEEDNNLRHMAGVERVMESNSKEALCKAFAFPLRKCLAPGGLPASDPSILPFGFCDEPCGQFNNQHFCCCDPSCGRFDDCCEDSTTLSPTGSPTISVSPSATPTTTTAPTTTPTAAPTTSPTTAPTAIPTFADDVSSGTDNLATGGCPDEVFQCPEGNLVTRDPNRDCEFLPCSNAQAVSAPDGNANSGKVGDKGNKIGGAFAISVLAMAALTASVVVTRRKIQRRNEQAEEQQANLLDQDSDTSFQAPPSIPGMQPIVQSVAARNAYSAMMTGGEEVPTIEGINGGTSLGTNNNGHIDTSPDLETLSYTPGMQPIAQSVLTRNAVSEMMTEGEEVPTTASIDSASLADHEEAEVASMAAINYGFCNAAGFF